LADLDLIASISLTQRPRAGNKTVNLFDLLQKVVERGGFEVLSAAHRGGEGWREVTRDLGWQGQEHLSFLVKDIYLRNLAYVSSVSSVEISFAVY
jgi:hypothetical protein